MVGLECWDPGRQLVWKLSHSQTSWSGSFLTLCCFSEGSTGQSLSSQAMNPWLWDDRRCSSHSGQVGEAAAAQPQHFWALPLHWTPQLRPLPQPRASEGQVGEGCHQHFGSDPDEEKWWCLSTGPGEKCIFPLLLSLHVQIRFSQLRSYFLCTIIYPWIIWLKKEVIFSKKLLITLVRKFIIMPVSMGRF